MSHSHWMRFLTVVFIALIANGAACSKPAPFAVKDKSPRSDKDAPFDPPSQYPEWAYNAPFHAKPAEELKAEPSARPSDPPHYFTKEKVVLIRRPTGYVPEEVPQVAIWWTSNNGFSWQKAGYFGREQSFFAFEAEEDGDYGIRFVGPGQESVQNVVANPERVYHVDTKLPEVEVTIDPEQTWYEVGQQVTISWQAKDFHLIEKAVNIVMLIDHSADDARPVEVKRDEADEGSIAFTLPQDTLDHEVRFRVEALDRAGNLGLAFSHALQIVPDASFPPSRGPIHPTPLIEPQEPVEEQARIDTTTIQPAMPVATDASPIVDSGGQSNPTVAQQPIDEEELPIESASTTLQTALPAPAQPVTVNETHVQREAVSSASGDTARPIAPASPEVEELLPMTSPTPEFSNLEDSAVGVEPLTTPFGSTLGRSSTTPVNFPSASPGTPATAMEDEEPISRSTTVDSNEDELEPLEDLIDLNEENGAPAPAPGLGVPMPATLNPAVDAAQPQPGHPWRVIGRLVDSSIETVWGLPKPRPAGEATPIFEGRILAEEPLEPEPLITDKGKSLAGSAKDDEPADPLDKP